MSEGRGGGVLASGKVRLDIGRKDSRFSKVGLLIFGFYFTSKILLVKVHLLVKLEQHSKKDIV